MMKSSIVPTILVSILFVGQGRHCYYVDAFVAPQGHVSRTMCATTTSGINRIPTNARGGVVRTTTRNYSWGTTTTTKLQLLSDASKIERRRGQQAQHGVSSKSITTQCYMYNLPPSGGGGGDNNNGELQGLLSGLGIMAMVALFFASPLGSIFFAITNSLFLLALLLPIGAVVAFQAWQFFYTLPGPCPNCGAPVRVLKDDAQPSLCFSCGAVIQPSSDGTTIEFAKERSTITMDEDGWLQDEMGYGEFQTTAESIFDALLNPNPTNGGGATTTTTATTTRDSAKAKESKYKREQTVIDVTVEEE